MAAPSAPSASPPRLSRNSLESLRQNGYVILPNFIDDTTPLKEDLLHLRSSRTTTPSYFTVAKIGHEGQIQDANTPFRDIRVSETCSLWDQDHGAENLPPSVAREDLYRLLDGLRTDIRRNGSTTANDDHDDQNATTSSSSSACSTIQLDETVQEVMYAWYPNGGYYRRHVDAETATTSTFRTYSFLLYLSDWQMTDGGCLRLHFDGGMDEKPAAALPCFLDVPPAPGTLVVFRSDFLPHEVLPYYGSQRMAVVGWFWGPAAAAAAAADTRIISSEPPMLKASVFELLLHLREIVPNLRSGRLETTTVGHHHVNSSDCAHDDDPWGIVMPSASPKDPLPDKNESLHSEDDPRYWNKIAKFHPVTGQLVTLSLSGLRCRKVSFDLSSALDLHALTTLDLSNTDMAANLMVALLEKATDLKYVRLGGNAWPDLPAISNVAAALSPTVQVVDCRYSQWTADHLEAFLFPHSEDNGITTVQLQKRRHLADLQKLYVEGNSLGDDLGPLVAWMATSARLRELYLGQNGIGPDGALPLSQIDCPTLVKLYLEGNRLGASGAQILLRSETLLRHSLEKLYVENNDIPKELALQLGQALHSPTMIGEGGLFQ